MSNYVQFKDGVAFAFVASDSPIPNAVILDAEVDPESVLGKTYANGAWADPAQIRYVQSVSPDGVLTGVGTTVYESDVSGEILPDSVQIGYKKVNGEWVDVESIKASTRPVGFWSWIWDESTLSWHPPVPMPQEGSWQWNEDTLSWDPSS